jgi:hypothetical protein
MRGQNPCRIVAGVLSLGLALVACGDNQDPMGADALWDKIHEEGYTAFARAPGYATPKPAEGPHGDEVVVYVNDTLNTALEGSASKEWPIGSLIIKDALAGGEVSEVSAMEKRSDGWYWAEWSLDGAAKYSGKPGLCTGCHESGSDFVRAFALPR